MKRGMTFYLLHAMGEKCEKKQQGPLATPAITPCDEVETTIPESPPALSIDRVPKQLCETKQTSPSSSWTIPFRNHFCSPKMTPTTRWGVSLVFDFLGHLVVLNGALDDTIDIDPKSLQRSSDRRLLPAFPKWRTAAGQTTLPWSLKPPFLWIECKECFAFNILMHLCQIHPHQNGLRLTRAQALDSPGRGFLGDSTWLPYEAQPSSVLQNPKAPNGQHPTNSTYYSFLKNYGKLRLSTTS